jgi:excisionase family DNA binding protein
MDKWENLTPDQRRRMGQSLQKVRLSRSVAEISEVTGLSIPFLRRKISEGELRARRIGRRVIVLEEDLFAFLRGADSNEDKEAA